MIDENKAPETPALDKNAPLSKTVIITVLTSSLALLSLFIQKKYIDPPPVQPNTAVLQKTEPSAGSGPSSTSGGKGPNVPQNPLSPEKRLVTDRKLGVSHEVAVIFYNGASEPEFFVDNKPVSVPPPYSAGTATFRLMAGVHRVRAEYSNRVCSATVVVPANFPVAANCDLK